MRFPSLLLAVALAFSAAAYAAEEPKLGLDLTSDEPPKAEVERGKEPPKASPAPSEPKAAAAVAPPASDVEKEVWAEDRVKAVQHKPFLKRMRFEATPMGFVSVNDGFYPKMGLGIRALFHLQDSFGVGLRGFQYYKLPSNNIRFAKRELQSRAPFVLPLYSIAADAIWSPIYGKIALFNAIRQFDVYLVGGVGVVNSQTSDADGLHLSTHLGLGQRFTITDYLTVDVSAIESIFPDDPGRLIGKPSSVLQHTLTVNLGVSVFFPFGFDYKD